VDEVKLVPGRGRGEANVAVVDAVKEGLISFKRPGPRVCERQVQNEGVEELTPLLDTDQGSIEPFGMVIKGTVVEEPQVNEILDDNSNRGIENVDPGSPNASPDSQAIMVQIPDASKIFSGNVVRVFRFKTNGVFRTAEVRHKGCVWLILVDGIPAASCQHSGSSKDKKEVYCVDFLVAEFPEESTLASEERLGRTLKASCTIRWSKQKMRWAYAVDVNSMPVPAYFSNAGPRMSRTAYVPDVIDVSNNLYSSDEIARTNSEYLSVQRSNSSNLGQGGEGEPEYKINRVFRFLMCDEMRGIEVAHENKVWYILVDGSVVKSLNHVNGAAGVDPACVITAYKRPVFGCDFPVKLHSGTEVPACMKMEWNNSKFLWVYSLVVNGKYVPECSFKGSPINPTEHFSIDIPAVPHDPVEPMNASLEGWKDVSWNMAGYFQEQEHSELSSLSGSFKTVRVYHFTTHRKFRSLAVLHASCMWKFVVDGVVQKELGHASSMFSTMKHSADLEIPMEGEASLSARMDMEWKPMDGRWYYTLNIGDMQIEPVYSNMSPSTAPIEEVVDRTGVLALMDLAEI